MKKILGILASPRKHGNCELAVKAVSRQIPQMHELKLLRLADFDLQPCRACYRCLFESERCALQDHLYTVLQAVLEADGLIVAAPTYFLGPNAALKRLIDRGLAFYPFAEQLWRKPALGIAVAGIEGKEGYTLLGVESILKLMLCDIRMTAVLYGALPGEILRDAGNAAWITRLARSLFDGPARRKQPVCNLCGGDTFRFLGPDEVRCMLCSNTGRVRWSEGGPVFEIQRSRHELFLSLQEALAHRDWLRGMKSRYLKQRAALQEIGKPYLKEGSWIKPQAAAATPARPEPDG